MMLFCIVFLQACQSSSPYHSPWDLSYPAQEQTSQASQPSERPDIGWQTNDKIESEALPEQSSAPHILRPNGAYGSAVGQNTRSLPTITTDPSQLARLDPNQTVSPYDAYRNSLGLPREDLKTIPTSPTPGVPRVDVTRPVTIAFLVPLSGKHKELGQGMLNAAQLALFDVSNDNFELIPRDTKGTKSGAVTAVQSAIASGTDLIIGPIFSSSLSVIKPIAQAAGVPVISFSTDWRLAGGNTYVMGFLPFAQVARVTNYAVSQGQQHYSFFAPKNDYSDVVLKTFQYTLSRKGLRVEKNSRYSALQTDLSGLVSDFSEYDIRRGLLEESLQMIQAQLEIEPENALLQEEFENLEDLKTLGKPTFDTLLLPIGGESLKSVSTLLSHYDIDKDKVRLIGTGLWDDISLTREPALYGAWFAAPDPQLRLDFGRKFKDLFGTKAPRLATLAYDATALASILARTNNSSNTPYTKLRLTNARGFAGIDGIFRFRHDGLIERGLAILEIRPSYTKVIDPAPKAFALH